MVRKGLVSCSRHQAGEEVEEGGWKKITCPRDFGRSSARLDAKQRADRFPHFIQQMWHLRPPLPPSPFAVPTQSPSSPHVHALAAPCQPRPVPYQPSLPSPSHILTAVYSNVILLPRLSYTKQTERK